MPRALPGEPWAWSRPIHKYAPKDDESGYQGQMRIIDTNEALAAFVAELADAP